MPDAATPPVQLRPALQALARAPEKLNPTRYWSALSPAERYATVEGVQKCRCGSDHHGLWTDLSRIARVQVPKLKQRPAAEIVAALSRRPLPAPLAGSLALHFFSTVLEEECGDFLRRLRADPGADDSIPIYGSIRASPERVPTACLYLMGAYPAERAVLLIMGVYLHEKNLRPFLGEWLTEMANKPLETTLSAAAALVEAVNAQHPGDEDAGEAPAAGGAPEKAPGAELSHARQEVAAVRNSLTRLTLELRDAAERAAAGSVPPESLDATLAEVRARFRAMDEAVRAAVSGHNMEAGLPAEDLSVVTIERLLDLWQEQEASASLEAQAGKARIVAKSVLRIGAQVRSALEPAHEDARRVLALLDGEPGDEKVSAITEIVEGKHPLALLFAAALRPDEAEADDKVTMGNQIGAAYGVPLAMEMAFGRLWMETCEEQTEEPRAPSAPAETQGNAAVGETQATGRVGEEVQDEALALVAEELEASASAGSEEEAGAASVDPDEVVKNFKVEVEPEAAPSPEEGTAGPGPVEPDSTLEPAELSVAVGEPVALDGVEKEKGSPEEPAAAAPEDDDLWSADGLSLIELAESFRTAEAERKPDIAEPIIFKLLRRGHRGMASHVGAWVEEASPETPPDLPLWLLQALAISPVVAHSVSEAAYALRDRLASFSEDLLEGPDAELNQARALLLASAAIRPALLAPGTLAGGTLIRAKSHLGRLDQLWQYCESIAHFSSRGVALDSSVLKGVRGQASWEAEVADLMERTEHWCAHAPRMNLKFAPATRVWMKWQERGGVIHQLLEPVRENDTKRLDFVRSEIVRLSDSQEIRRLVDHTDRNIIERRVGEPVSFKAYNQFSARVREAIGLAREWVDLQEDAPGEASSYRVEQADRIRKELLTRHKAVLEELGRFESSITSGPLRSAIVCVREAVQDLDALFSGSAPLVREEISPLRALNADLLQVTGLDLTEEWALVQEDPPQVMDMIARALAAGPLPSWAEAFRTRTEEGDHTGGGLLLSLLEATRGVDESTLDEWRRTRLRLLSEDQGMVRRIAEATERHVDQSVMFGIIGESEREMLMDRVRTVSESLDTSEAMHRMRAELASVSAELGLRRQELADELREEMFRLGIDAFHTEYGRITAVLERGDLLTAREYIHHLERGNAIREEEETSSAFAVFFPTAVNDLERYRIANPSQLLDAVRESRPFACVNMEQVPEPQARQAADALAAWFRARMRKNTPENEVARAIFSFLGFNVLDVTTQQLKGKGSRAWSEIYTEPVKDRSRCPVAYYGSIAAGGFTSDRARYRVLWQWDEPSAEDLVGAVGETSHEGPTFVFYFGKLSEERRRSLARLSRKDKRTFLVIDDILLLYLCGESAARMPVMFQCALPFTHLEPYVTTASLVPPEVFYGREEDRSSIMDVHGSCFIYGGRQLGKTALLRDVERRFNDPDTGRVALYVDLKGEGIGFNRPVEDIWPLLAEKFKAIGVLPTSVSSHVNPEKILGEIRKWLDADMRRRILLLLDETDRFLEGDRDFVLIARLKKEMEDTGRRFKVVFAGLHNVQRTTRLGNNPLAHLGEPRCIGPLFENLEWREARDLVKEPLAAIGYEFESEDLVVRILSQTNYYPSLLQLYCTQLLRHVNRPNVEIFDSRSGPPYVITSKHVEDAYQSQELWQRIRERFNWTLDLDPRYRLIALLIAHYSGGQAPEPYQDGFSAAQIRALALHWWARGFAEDRSEEGFSALLDEMVGLGILRQTDRGRYRMRTGNVMLLLGTPEEIDAALVTMSSQEPPRPYEALTFRRPLTRSSVPEQGRSPLTAQQESLLQKRENGVIVVFGSEAAGLSDLPATLPEVMGESFLISLRHLNDRGQFKRELEGLRARSKDGVTLVVVEPSCLWSEYWVRDAVEKISALKSKQNFVRVLFVADPEKVWQLIHSGQPAWSHIVRHRNVNTFSLRPWHEASTRAWLDEQRVPATLMERYLHEFQSRTGAWPSLLYELMASLTPNAPGRWKSEWDAFEVSWADPERTAARRSAFGFGFPGPGAVAELLTMGSASVEDLAEVSGIPLATAEAELRWLDLLGLAGPTEEATWILDSTVRHLLSTRPTEAHDRVLVEPARA
jgi:Cdc6-like AAA superfamily ATPase